jgi:hypothetical protein
MAQYIDFGIGSPDAVPLGTVRNFFGVKYYTDQTIPMGDLYRGGELVPNISGNNSIPTSGTISLSQFYDCVALLQFDKNPPNKVNSIPYTMQSSGTQQIQWVQNINSNQEADFDVGYGGQKNSGNLEYRWVITNATALTRVVASGNFLYPSTSTYYTPWYQGYGVIQLEKDWTYAAQEYQLSGTAQCQVRKYWDGSYHQTNASTATWYIEKLNSIE